MVKPNWTLSRTLAPSGLAVTVAEAKAHLRVGGSTQDDLIESLVKTATEQFEYDVERAVLPQTFKLSLKDFPSGCLPFDIPMRPIQSISSIIYMDEDNAQQTLSTSDYSLNAESRQVFCSTTSGWPDTYQEFGSFSVFVTFVAGLAVDDVPELYKTAIKLEVGRLFFDPAQENQVNSNDGKTYERIVAKLMRSSYP